MDADDGDFIRAMRRIVDNADGNENVRMPRNVLARLVDLAEAGHRDRWDDANFEREWDNQ